MYLQKISLSNFKNIQQEQVAFCKGINCINGDNGQGKTNMLDAIYYLSMTRSYFSSTDSWCIRSGEEQCTIAGSYVKDDNTEETIGISFGKATPKTVRRGKKAYTRFSDHIGFIPVVMSSPTDTALVTESGEERRRFVNMLLSQTDRSYLKNLQSYNQLLQQRNKLLKQDNCQRELLEAIDFQMSRYADLIYDKRKELCHTIAPMVEYFHNRLSGGKEKVLLQYVSDLDNGNLADLLSKDAEKERIMKFTLSGIHRDDIVFSIDGHPLKKYGSQGQQKSFLIALKLAQFSVMKERCGFCPILLLDDVFDKLDSHRVEMLIEMAVSEDFGQIFITDSNKVRIGRIMDALSAQGAIFIAQHGSFTKNEPSGTINNSPE